MSSEPDHISNHFVHRSAARRYAAARPYFHPLVAEQIRSYTGIQHFSRALDVACGTGQSTRALGAIAEAVYGMDISPEMLGEAAPAEGIHFMLAPAEALPFPNGVFGLATVGLAFHWFDQPLFLRETHRVLAEDGWLVIYTSGFYGEMLEDPAFRAWAWEDYPARFPAPPRGAHGIKLEEAGPHGFAPRHTEGFLHHEVMYAEQLSGYLLTQTNVIAAVEGGQVPLEEAHAWILEGVRPFFANEQRTMKFGGSISLLQRTVRSETPAG